MSKRKESGCLNYNFPPSALRRMGYRPTAKNMDTMNYRKLRESIKFGCDLPKGWYVFIFPDGSRSHEMTGTNYPTSDILITVHGGENLKDAYIRAKEQLAELEYRGVENV